MESKKRVLKEGHRTFTIALSPADQQTLDELTRRMGKTRSGAARVAIRMALHLLQAQQDQHKQTALVDEKSGRAAILHFVM